jgi:phosphatidylglycerol:prolipoprotein diacylglycerol transferase
LHPYLFHAGHLFLPTFGVLAAVGLMLALALSAHTAALAGASPDAVWDAGLLAVVAAFVCSRLLLVVAHLDAFRRYPVLLLAVPSLTPAGLLLTGVLVYLYLRRRGLRVLQVLDAWAPCVTLLWMFLALGHFAEGSDPGVPTGVPWGLRLGGADRVHPIALYAAMLAAVLTLGLYSRLKDKQRVGGTAGTGLALAGVCQFVLSFWRQPGNPLWRGLDELQVVALGMIVAGGLFIAWAWQDTAREPSEP